MSEDRTMQYSVRPARMPPLAERALARLGEPGVMDLPGAVGYYTMLATVLNVTRIQPEGIARCRSIPCPARLTRKA